MFGGIQTEDLFLFCYAQTDQFLNDKESYRDRNGCPCGDGCETNKLQGRLLTGQVIEEG